MAEIPAPKPVTFAGSGSTSNTAQKAEPLYLVGKVPASGITAGVAVANATVATDGTSAGTQLNALLASLRAAGIIAP